MPGVKESTFILYGDWLLLMRPGLEARLGNDYTQVLDLLSKAAAVNPNNADIWANLGGACYTMGDYPRAKAVRKMPSSSTPRRTRRGGFIKPCSPFCGRNLNSSSEALERTQGR